MRHSCDSGAVLYWRCWGQSAPGAVLCLLRPSPLLNIPVGSGHHRQRQPRRLWEKEAIPWRSLAGDFAVQSATQGHGDGARSSRICLECCRHWGAAVARAGACGGRGVSVHGVGLSLGAPGGTGGPADTHTRGAGEPRLRNGTGAPGEEGMLRGVGAGPSGVRQGSGDG